MIEFMVIGAPRSGTTWAANWLTTDTTLCIHDPLSKYGLLELDNIPTGGKKLGVSCTGLGMFSKWVNGHTAPKVVLHRSVEEINLSLHKLGLPPLDPRWPDWLHSIAGWHIPWDFLFHEPAKVYEYLLNKPFDYQRYAELRAMLIEPHVQHIHQDPKVLQELISGLQQQLALGV
jgi:hypothetical protein